MDTEQWEDWEFANTCSAYLPPPHSHCIMCMRSRSSDVRTSCSSTGREPQVSSAYEGH